MIRRPRRSIPATLTALVLLAACVLVAVCAVQLTLGEPALINFTALAQTAHETQWTDRTAALAGGVAVLLGLLLVLAAVVPGKSLTLALTADESTIEAGISRGSLRTVLRAEARVDGVVGAAIRLRRKRIRVIVRTNRTNTDGLADAVRAAIEHRLGQIALARQPSVVVKVNATRSTR
jgi:hypothetical protein